ncbi:MAG: sulfatase-like hydrolase/transferase [Rhodocyclaceae bacterium]|nr:MAG: sulfatase-like hydrolase/transferase [Rhodocyclaceae bacterium]MBE7424264.1 sulfatase-like hydrolase/transferase [Zoogloeaceae bacterium]CAG0929152.1 arylsulfatase [Rhodocyclaceae bacterium]
MSEESKPMTNKPNILMIVTDQEYAHQPMPADFALPARDRIRARGVTFTSHHCTTTVCTPSRSVIYTGQHTPHTRMFDNTNFAWIDDMKADPKTLPTIGHMLRDLGYHTVYKGKWHLSEFPTKGSCKAMEAYGFSEYQDSGDVQGGPMDGVKKDPLIAADAVEWLNKRATEVSANKPWFMSVNFVNPHDVMFYDTDDKDSVQVKGMFPIFGAPDTPLYRQKWQTTLPASFFDDLEGQPPAVRTYKHLCDVYYGRIPMDHRDMWHNHVNYYLNCHLDVDRHIGAVLDALDASGQADNTIVIFTADHGEQGGAHHLRQKGSVAFKETVNVPLVIADPRHPGANRTDAVGSHLDLVPTILAFAGLSEAERRKRYPFLKGHDLSGVVHDPASVGPRGSRAKPGKGSLMTYDMIATIDAEWFNRNATKVFDAAAAQAGQEFHRGQEAFKGLVKEIGVPNLEKREMFRGIFDGRYKLVRYFGMGHYNLPSSVKQLLADNDVALYDLLLDPEEMDNLANPANPKYSEELLSAMNQKLNALIDGEIGEDKALFTPPKEGPQK